MFGSEFSKNLRSKLNSVISFVTDSSKGNMKDSSDKEVDEENGFVFSVRDAQNPSQEYYIPEEILALILSYVNIDDLAKRCRLVCQTWKGIVENLAIRYKAERECASSLKKGIVNKGKTKAILPWDVYYWILNKDIFGRNLLKNNCGQDNFNNWQILSNGGDKFIIEAEPSGSDPLPDCDDFEGHKSCFATSYHSNAKIQVINLSVEGLGPSIMDKYQPDIIVSEWFAGRYDCGCVYELNVTLLDESKRKKISEFSRREEIEQWGGREWKQVTHTFRNYGRGVRYISFYHGGMDTQFWAGHYGCKISGGVVKIIYSLTDIASSS